MKFYDLFAGIGGFRLGLCNASSEYRCIGSCEINKYAREIYKHNFGEYPTEKDIRMVNVSELPDFDILTAGFPCQPFSLAGKRMGFSDPRGTMFFEIVRIIREKRPQTLFLENVKGLLNHDGGKTLITILNTLDELGYDAEWQVVNGKYFVPQNRERIFIIGHIRDKPFKQVFPIREPDKIYVNEDRFIKKEKDSITEQVSCSLRVRNKKSGGDSTLLCYQDVIRPIKYSNSKMNGSRTMITMLTEKRSENAKEERKQIRQKTGKDYSSRRDKIIAPREDNLSGCLTASKSVDKMLLNGSKIRMLTPLECERLMGFPDNWTDVKDISDTQRYKCLGNAVIPLVIKEIGKKLLIN